jgi:hypothetical protein
MSTPKTTAEALDVKAECSPDGHITISIPRNTALLARDIAAMPRLGKRFVSILTGIIEVELEKLLFPIGPTLSNNGYYKPVEGLTLAEQHRRAALAEEELNELKEQGVVPANEPKELMKACFYLMAKYGLSVRVQTDA